MVGLRSNGRTQGTYAGSATGRFVTRPTGRSGLGASLRERQGTRNRALPRCSARALCVRVCAAAAAAVLGPCRRTGGGGDAAEARGRW